MANSSTKKHQRQQAHNSASLAKAGTLNRETTLNALTSTGLLVQGSLSQIQEQLINKFAELDAVEESIKLKKQEMENLHGVDSVLMTLDEAKAQNQQELVKMEKEREALKEQAKELKFQLDTQRQREESDYQYNLAQKRKQETDAWNEQVRQRAAEERDRKDAFEKDLNSRHELLAQKESTYQAAITRFDSLETEIKGEVDRAVAIERNRLTKDFTHEKQLLEIKHASETDKVKSDNTRLSALNVSLEKQVGELQTRLQQAYEKNTELAARAVESSANTKALADMQSLFTNTNGAGNGTRTRS